MSVETLMTALKDLPLSVAISQSDWMYPTLETLHVLALAIVLGSIAMLDLRLIGVARRAFAVSDLAGELLLWTWAGFVAAVLSGLLMFASAADRFYLNTPFRVKMLLLLLAGINMAAFHLGAYRDVARWDRQYRVPGAVRLFGALSLCFWVGIVICGRWIGFV